MKPDLYIRAMLTIIAAALIWLCAENVISPGGALAQSSPAAQRVMIVGSRGQPVAVTYQGEIAVRVVP